MAMLSPVRRLRPWRAPRVFVGHVRASGRQSMAMTRVVARLSQ